MKTYIKAALQKRKSQLLSGVFVSVLMLLLISCGSTKNADDLQEFRELEEMVENREFQVENRWALPMGGGNINLIGNPNFIRFEGDSVDIFLPYFGVRHSGGGYNSEGGIRYKGPAKDLSITEGRNKEKIVLNFEGGQQGENLDFSVTLYPNGNAHTSVISSQRQSINYQGKVKETPEKQQER